MPWTEIGFDPLGWADYRPGMTDSPPLLRALDRDLLVGICGALRIRRLVLFGSHATGSPPPNEESDVDLAISLDAGAERHSFFDYVSELGRLFPSRAVDVAFLADADPLFRWEIMREGVRIWGDEIDYLEFRAFAYRDFVDSADLRALERILFEKKMEMIRRRLNAQA